MTKKHVAKGIAALVAAGTAAGTAAAPGSRKDPSPRSTATQSATTAQLAPKAAEHFERHIRPLLLDKCYNCHSSLTKEPMGGLRLDGREFLLKGGKRGAAIVPGNPEKSLLLRSVNHTAPGLKMPPSGKLTPAQIAHLTTWVKGGAPWPAPEKVGADPNDQGPKPNAQNHWAFQPIRKPAIPSVKARSWVKNPIDAFVLAELEEKGLKPAPTADRRTLIRRATFDLTGLPPTPAEVAAFVNDPSPDAWEKLIDRLLASPRYGERWGRRWLDVARYGDSNGLDENLCFANAWRYRDYVIAAFNQDKPFDRFVHEQVAGDLLPRTGHEAEDNARVVATGFLSLGAKMLAEDDPVKMEMDIIDEQLDTLGKAFMGLTLGCARCHDHKYDPVSQKDYYALAGILKSTKTMENFSVVAVWHENVLASEADQKRLQAHEQRITQRKHELKTRTELANSAFLAEERRKASRYLLAATQLLRQGEARLSPVAEKPGFGKAGAAQIIEAENYARGNVRKDRDTYGAGIGVLVNQGQYPNFTEYELTVPSAGAYQVDLRYAAAESRPVHLLVNGTLVKSEAARQVTGSWMPEGQKWFAEGVFILRAGVNLLRLERVGQAPFPHIDKLQVSPFHLPDGAEAPVTPEQLVQERKLNLALLRQWTAYLRRTQGDAASVLAPWHARAGTRAGASVPGAVEALLGESSTTSLAALADRYQQLWDATERAWQAHRKYEPAATALKDPVQEALRQVLHATDGPYALPPSPEIQYPPATEKALKLIADDIQQLEKSRPEFPRALGVREGKPTDLRVHLRGNYLTLGEEAPRGFIRAISHGDPALRSAADQSGRLQLAHWLTAPENPLTARVIVNRVWLGHFGEGIVRSPDNFGKLGEQPSHPDLLDWLATVFTSAGEVNAGQGSREQGARETRTPWTAVASGSRGSGYALRDTQHGFSPSARRPMPNAHPGLSWSIKKLHRLIMTSSAYRMSTAYNAKAARVDPENRLLWRMNRRRLDVEEIRDGILSVSGKLDLTMGGTLLPLKNREYVTSTANRDTTDYNSPRRAVYLPVVRSSLYDVFTAFDFGDPSVVNGQRLNTTVAPQALFMLNGELMARHTLALAQSLLAQEELDDRTRLNVVYERCFSRAPTPEETLRMLAFLQRIEAAWAMRVPDAGARRLKAWQSVCRVLLASNEFLYVE